MADVKVVEVDIDNDCKETVVTNEHHLQESVNCLEGLLHNLKLAYDIQPNNRLSSIIVAQELSLRELRSLLPK